MTDTVDTAEDTVGHRILIVDKDPAFRRDVIQQIEKWGYTADECEDGESAFNTFWLSLYRIVILDVDLPLLSGPELCRKIRSLERSRYTYIIFYSSKTDEDSLLSATESGADDVLPKPFSPFDLKLCLKNATRLLTLNDELYMGGGTDRYTGVVNKAAFAQFFSVMNAHCRRGDLKGALMFILVTNFEDVLSEAGFQTAHNMMLELGRILRSCHRASDLLARTGEDEFCLMLQNTSWDVCLPVAEKITERAEAISATVDGKSYAPKIRISSVNFPSENKLTPEKILKTAPRIPYDPPNE